MEPVFSFKNANDEIERRILAEDVFLSCCYSFLTRASASPSWVNTELPGEPPCVVPAKFPCRTYR